MALRKARLVQVAIIGFTVEEGTGDTEIVFSAKAFAPPDKSRRAFFEAIHNATEHAIRFMEKNDFETDDPEALRDSSECLTAFQAQIEEAGLPVQSIVIEEQEEH